jgi:hypothetical protein
MSEATSEERPHEKAVLRKRLRAMLAAQSPEDRHARSLAATSLLTATPEFAAARIVMLYLSMPHELDTTTLALRCWQQGKMVVVPKVSWEQRRMIPVEINSLSDEHLTVTGPGIREPIAENPMPVNMVDLVIVPALGAAWASTIASSGSAVSSACRAGWPSRTRSCRRCRRRITTCRSQCSSRIDRCGGSRRFA